MILEYVSEKMNLITVSQAADGDGLSPKLAEGKISVKDEPGDIYWFIDTQVDGTAWININFFEPTDIYEVEFSTNSLYNSVDIEWSLDGMNWYLLPKQGAKGWSGYSNIRVTYLRLLFNELAAGFELTSWRCIGDEDFIIEGQLLSITAKRYYPQRFFEKKEMIPETVRTYLEMLERNDRGPTIKPWLIGDCAVNLYLIFDEGEEGSGAINSNHINAVAINSGGSTTFASLGSAIINRVAGGGAFYDIDGDLTPGITLRFNAVVSCEDLAPSDRINYRWEFNDPNSSSSNPTTVPTSDYGEQLHTFTRLGYYDVEFHVLRNGRQFTAVQRVEILPAQYVIIGPELAEEDSEYTVHGLTEWPFPQDTNSGQGDYAPAIITDSTRVEFNPAQIYLEDDGNRVFTIRIPGATPIGTGFIRIFDEFYGEWKELSVSFD